DELAMGRQALGLHPVALGQAFEERADILARHIVGERRPAPGHDALADHYLAPAVVEEQFLLFADEQPGFAEQTDLLPKCVGKLHVPAIFPERTLAAVREIMKRDEVADSRPFAVGKAIERVARGWCRGEIAWQEVQQPPQRRLDKVDAGRFQRFHETRGEPQREAIVRPEGLAPPTGKLDRARVGERWCVERSKKVERRLVIRNELAAI